MRLIYDTGQGVDINPPVIYVKIKCYSFLCYAFARSIRIKLAGEELGRHPSPRCPQPLHDTIRHSTSLSLLYRLSLERESHPHNTHNRRSGAPLKTLSVSGRARRFLS